MKVMSTQVEKNERENGKREEGEERRKREMNGTQNANGQRTQDTPSFDECGIKHHDADVVAKMHSPTSCPTLRIAYAEYGLTTVRQLSTKATAFIVG